MNKPLDAQIDDAVERHTRQLALQECFNQLTGEQRADVRRELATAMLSGMALTVSFEISNDGSLLASPHMLQKAIFDAAQRRGLTVGKIS